NLSNMIAVSPNAGARANGTVAAWLWTPNNPYLTNVPPAIMTAGMLEGANVANLALLLAHDFPATRLPDALNTTALVTSSRGAAQWFGQTNTTHDGASAAQSADIGNNTATSMRFWVAGPITLNF